MKTTIKKKDDGPSHGAVDGGHHYLCCTNCQAVLMDVMVTHPGHKQFTWRLKAKNCPFCDENPKTAPLGGSDPVTVTGMFVVGGYGKMRDGSEEDDIPSTTAEASEDDCEDGDIHLFDIKKATKDARPVRRRPQ